MLSASPPRLRVAVFSLAAFALVNLMPSARGVNVTLLEQALSVQEDGVSQDDQFGGSVAMEGTTAVVGSPYDSTPTREWPGSAYVFAKVGGKWSFDTKLIPGTLDSGFGKAVAISGDTMAILTNQAVCIFVRGPGGWAQQARIDGTTVHFSSGVSLSGDTLLVGGLPSTNMGAAYVFTRSGTAWTQQAVLLASDGVAGDSFGGSVALAGDLAAVGARTSNLPSKTGAGAVYVYSRSGTTWTQMVKLNAADAAAGDAFGASVALSSNTLLVGATAADGTVANVGGAYVYGLNAGNWTQQGKLVPLPGLAYSGQMIGNTVSLSGDRAVLGQRPGGSYPTAWVFERSGSTWSYDTKLSHSGYYVSTSYSNAVVSGTEVLVGIPGMSKTDAYSKASGTWSAGEFLPAPTNQRSFGAAVAVHGNLAVVGASTDMNADGIETGSVYTFTRSGTTWTQQARLLPETADKGFGFGAALALDGGTLLVGSRGTDYNASHPVHVFVLNNGVWTLQAALVPSDGAAGKGFGYCIALSGDTAIVGCPNHDSASGLTETGEAYVFTRSGSVWTERKRLAPSTLPQSSYFGIAVALEGTQAVVCAQNETIDAAHYGRVYAYQGSGASWSLKQKLRAAESYVYGMAVQISHDRLLVTGIYAIGPPENGIYEDHGYMYARSGGLWTQQAVLKAEPTGNVGNSAVLSEYAAILGPNNTLFLRKGSTWAASGDLGAVYGAIDGDTLILGNPYPKDPGSAVVHRLVADVTLLDGASPSSPEVTSDVNFGRTALGVSFKRSFTLRNDGVLPLSNLAVAVSQETNAEDVAVTSLKTTKLEPGASTTFTVTYKPMAAGPRYTALVIASDDPDEPVLYLGLTSEAAEQPEPPSIITQPQSMSAGIGFGGTEVAFYVDATGTQALAYQWKKNGKAIKGANASSYYIGTAAGKQHVGSYTVTVSNKWGSVTSDPAYFTMAVPATEETPVIPVSVVEGETLTLKAPIFGSGTVQWMREGSYYPIENDARISGASTPKLVIRNTDAGLYFADAGLYHVFLYDAYYGPFRVATFDVTVLSKPVVAATSDYQIPAWLVSGLPEGLPGFVNNPDHFYASGLPPGVRLHPTLGTVLGSPTTPGFYTVRLWASNAAGTSLPWTGQVIVYPMNLSVPGIYVGIVGPSELLNQGLGGRFSMSVTTTGAFSGSVTMGTRSYRFASRLVRTAGGYYSSEVCSGYVDLGRAPDGRPLHLEFQIDSYGGMAGAYVVAVSDDLTDSATITAYRHGDYSLRSMDHSGTYNLLLTPSGSSAAPAGTGYAFFNVAKTGAGTLVMKLPDNSTVTAGGSLVSSSALEDWLPVYSLMYNGTGSILGFTVAGTNLAGGGLLSWYKNPTYHRSGSNYPLGWDTQSLSAVGGRYQRPPAGTNALRTLDADPNVRLSCSGLPSVTAIDVPFYLSTSSKAAMPGVTDNPAKVSFSIDPATGFFSGAFTLVDPDPRDESGVKVISRRVTYQGLLIPDYYYGSGTYVGAGFSLVPPLAPNLMIVVPYATSQSASVYLSAQ